MVSHQGPFISTSGGSQRNERKKGYTSRLAEFKNAFGMSISCCGVWLEHFSYGWFRSRWKSSMRKGSVEWGTERDVRGEKWVNV